jgi:hypothetical protein
MQRCMIFADTAAAGCDACCCLAVALEGISASCVRAAAAALTQLLLRCATLRGVCRCVAATAWPISVGGEAEGKCRWEEAVMERRGLHTGLRWEPSLGQQGVHSMGKHLGTAVMDGVGR